MKYYLSPVHILSDLSEILRNFIKRLMNLFLSTLIGGILLTSNSFAGVNYIQYNENFQRQKEDTSSPAKEQRPQETNKYFREQQENKVTPKKECDPNRATHKSDRCYWSPTE